MYLFLNTPLHTHICGEGDGAGGGPHVIERFIVHIGVGLTPACADVMTLAASVRMYDVGTMLFGGILYTYTQCITNIALFDNLHYMFVIDMYVCMVNNTLDTTHCCITV